MRRMLVLVLLATVGGTALAQTRVYETKGPDGPSFSDQSAPGAVVVDVPPAHTIGQVPAAPPAQPYVWRAPASAAPAGSPPPLPAAAPSSSPGAPDADSDSWAPAYGAYPPYAHPAAAAAAWDRALRYGPGWDPRLVPPPPVRDERVAPPAVDLGGRGRR